MPTREPSARRSRSCASGPGGWGHRASLSMRCTRAGRTPPGSRRACRGSGGSWDGGSGRRPRAPTPCSGSPRRRKRPRRPGACSSIAGHVPSTACRRRASTPPIAASCGTACSGSRASPIRRAAGVAYDRAPSPAARSPAHVSADPVSLATPYRTHTNGELRASDAGSRAKLAGWVHRRRDYGKLIFIDLRDRHGITQVVIDAADAAEAHAQASRLRSEFVVAFEGEVARRQPGTENAKLATGEVELQARSVTILNEAKTPPFYINDPDATIDESLRLRYRYLDIRREAMQRRLLLRSRLVQAIRETHHRAGFVEVETPNLIKSTPEGARDFIVPSRLQPGSVYALPQSPQQLKQLLMVAGVDRYFQIARCFRDEDLRGDRQPEFTQLDLEMSFVDEAAVMEFVERMAIEVSRAVVPARRIQETPFPRFTYEEAIERYGSDKPDLRFGMELVDLAPALGESSGFRVFDEAVAAGGRVKAIVAPGMAG